MKKNLGCLIGLSFVAIFIGVFIIGGFTMLSQRNVAVSLEEQIEAKHIANQTDYDKMVKTAKEMAQVTDMYAEDFEKIYKGLIEGRNQDENLLFKVVKESNPNMDSSLYKNLQTQLSANRDLFSKKQEEIADLIREYNTYIRKKFIMAAITNRQPMKARDYVVTSQATEDAFNEGKAEEIQLRD